MRFPLPLPWRLLLLPLGLVYRLLVWIRLGAYHRGILAIHRVGTPVISVGNLTLGGSGKNPMVDFLLKLAQRQGKRAISISRGYRATGRSHLIRMRLSEGAPAGPDSLGDEPCLLAYRNPDHAIYVGKDRVAAARLAEVMDRPQLIVLDDGYQHLRLGRDLDILLLDAGQGLTGGKMVPSGALREPLSAMKRADMILLTKMREGNGEPLKSQLVNNPHVTAPVFTSGYVPALLRRLDGEAEMQPEALKGKTVGLWCAIANPGGFEETVTDMGAVVAERRFFRDHHPYNQQDIIHLENALASNEGSVDFWLTTEKDAVKLRDRIEDQDKLWVVEMELLPDGDAVKFLEHFINNLPPRNE